MFIEETLNLSTLKDNLSTIPSPIKPTYLLLELCQLMTSIEFALNPNRIVKLVDWN